MVKKERKVELPNYLTWCLVTDSSGQPKDSSGQPKATDNPRAALVCTLLELVDGLFFFDSFYGLPS